MANGIHPTFPQTRQDTIDSSRADQFPGALTMLAVVVFIAGLVLLYFFRNSSTESLVTQCEKSTVVAANLIHENAGNGKEWRRERQQAFQRCMDDSFQTLQKLRP